MTRYLPQNHYKQNLLVMLGRILQNSPQILSGNGDENLSYSQAIAHFAHRLRRTQPGSLQRKDILGLVSPEHESVISKLSPNSLTFPTMKAPSILLCSHSDLRLFHWIDTEKLGFFYTRVQKGHLFVWIQLRQQSQPEFLPKESPEPKYPTGEATKRKSRDILAWTQIPGRPCLYPVYSSHFFHSLTMPDVLSLYF